MQHIVRPPARSVLSPGAQPSIALRGAALPLLMVWVVLLGFDALSTIIAIALSAAEANPTLNVVAQNLGFPTMLVLKTLLGAGVGVFIWHRGDTRILRYLNIGMLVVVAVNLLTIGVSL